MYLKMQKRIGLAQCQFTTELVSNAKLYIWLQLTKCTADNVLNKGH